MLDDAADRSSTGTVLGADDVSAAARAIQVTFRQRVTPDGLWLPIFLSPLRV